MVADRFRDRAARMDRVLIDRLGDQATLEDGTTIRGAFASPFLGAQIGAKASGFRLGASIDADHVTEPTFTVRSVDAAKVKRGTFITIHVPETDGGGRYKMIKSKPDGAGMVDLVLGADSERSDDIK